jgi:hypothetical protein
MTKQESPLQIRRRRRVWSRVVFGAALAGAALSAGVTLGSAGAAQHGDSSAAPTVIPPEAVPTITTAPTASSLATAAGTAPSAVSGSSSSDGAATTRQSSTSANDTAPTPSAAPADTTTPGPTPSEPQLNPGPGGPPILAAPAPC